MWLHAIYYKIFFCKKQLYTILTGCTHYRLQYTWMCQIVVHNPLHAIVYIVYMTNICKQFSTRFKLHSVFYNKGDKQLYMHKILYEFISTH